MAEDLAENIAVAAFKVAAFIRLPRLRSEIENAAIDLLAAFSDEVADKLRSLIRFGQEVGQIYQLNGEVLVREIENLKSERKISATFEKSLPQSSVTLEQDLDLESFFGRRSSLPKQAAKQVKSRRGDWQRSRQKIERMSGDQGARRDVPDGTIQGETLLGGEGGSGTLSGDAAIDEKELRLRQVEEISAYMVDRGICRYRELEEAFPNVSERTLSRVLKNLIRGGKFERIGPPGPRSFYRPIGREVEGGSPDDKGPGPEKQEVSASPAAHADA
ncbi:MAG: hypothetical protein HY536_00265, partial [Candidatus Colwellbacteria bacterium]|nr:hypothetical protein [Candidatus Colwellbacteria bacterium]